MICQTLQENSDRIKADINFGRGGKLTLTNGVANQHIMMVIPVKLTQANKIQHCM